MRPLWKDSQKERICIPIVETSLEKALRAIKQANRLADLIELRIDYLKKPEIATLLHGSQKPFIITNRKKEEGGRYNGDERERLSLLKEAIDLDVEYIDVELRSEESMLLNVLSNKKKTQVILSFHDIQETPSKKALQKLFARITGFGADIVKIVTFARFWEDNFNLLSLISYARKRNQRIVAFCMGQKGQMSRIFSPLMGAAWTYASLDEKHPSAPGQLTVEEMRSIWNQLR
jgi:3-dehydroquinate dehydratase/shikimate dehydrogenase